MEVLKPSWGGALSTVPPVAAQERALLVTPKAAWASLTQIKVARARLLTLTAPEMRVLGGGLRLLGANTGQSAHGILTKRPETLTNDFFVNLPNMRTQWQPSARSEGV